MKKSGFSIGLAILSCLVFVSSFFTNCKKTDNPIKFPFGTFPDTVINISDINSPYDDYNTALYQISDKLPIIFSSNRKSAGGQFDLEQGSISYVFDQTTGVFGFGSEMTTDAFLDKLISKAKTTGNDFGPYRFFSKADGFEYLVLSSVNETGNLDLYYLKNEPLSGASLPDVLGPFPAKIMNTPADDVYFTFNTGQDTAYFASDKDGNFDIFSNVKPEDMNTDAWFNRDYAVPVKVDSLNSPSQDKCPFILKKIMVFASDRPGGMGGFDLYYSVMKNGKWSSPVNMGPRINTSADEYRPVLGYNQGFTNNFLIFSSNRPGGKGGFDLYFTGVEFP